MNSRIETLSWQNKKKHQIARNIIVKSLSLVKNANLTLIETNGAAIQLGDKNSDLHAEVIIRHPDFYHRMLTGGSIGAAEAYIEGIWDSPNLTNVVKVICRNLNALDKIEQKVGWLTHWLKKFTHWKNRNNKQNSRNNIMAHYDLGNELYRHFLDDNMLYSSAIYHSSSDSLELAQIQKMDRLCQMLNLKPEDHLIEVGSGWGAMAIHAAKHYGCKVTTTTISTEQYQWAKEKISAAGLEDKITLLKQDYRDLSGQYDKLVSIEMIEAVGKSFLPTYVKKCQSLLKPEGLMAIQAITIADQRYESYSKDVDFIQKYIFPGGFLPSISSLLEQFTKNTDLVLRDVKDIGLDYARTLADWHQRFDSNQEKLKTLGYDDKFSRLWRYYLSYCEGGFRERTISTVQLVLSRPDWRE